MPHASLWGAFGLSTLRVRMATLVVRHESKRALARWWSTHRRRYPRGHDAYTSSARARFSTGQLPAARPVANLQSILPSWASCSLAPSGLRPGGFFHLGTCRDGRPCPPA